MKLNLMKIEGVFAPADDIDAESAKKFANHEIFEVEIKLYRNPQFLSKMFVFFRFCFDHWAAEHPDLEFLDEKAQRDVFRKNLIAKAGYYNKFYNINGELRIEAKSLAFSNMEEEEFSQCYHAVIGAAMKLVFKGCDDVTEQTLLRFF